jgi:hypothetical protein
MGRQLAVRVVLAGAFQRSNHGASVEAGQVKKSPGPLSAQPPACHLIKHQLTLGPLVDEHTVYLGAVKAFD